MTPSERAALGRSRTFFAVLVNMSVMGPLALNIVMPSLPGLETVFAASRESVQLTISLYMLGTAFAQIVMGTLADYFGRRPVALAGAAIYALASIAAMFSPSIEALVAARFIQSVGATAGISLSRAIVRDVFDREKSASMIGYVTVGIVVAPMFAPLIGGLIDDNFGWRAIFLFCAVIGGLTLTGTALYLPETRPDTVAAGESGVIRRGLALLGNGRFHLYVLTGTFASCVFFAFIGGAPYLIINLLALPKSEYGIWFIVLSLGYMSGNFLAGRYSQRAGIERMMMIGCISTLIGALLVLAFGYKLLPQHPGVFFGCCVFFSTGNGLVMPNCVAGSVSIDPNAAATASGLMGFIMMIAAAAANFLAGQWTVTSGVPMGYIMAACGFACVFTAALAIRQVSQDLRRSA